MQTSALPPRRLSRLSSVALASFAVASLAAPDAAAQTATSAVPGLFNFQGKVANANGTLVGASPNPVNRTVIFRIWDHSSNSATANLIYSEQQVVTITDGEFSVLLGQGSAVTGTPLGFSESAKGPSTNFTIASPSVFGGATRYLGITIDDNNSSTTDPEITPRQQLVTSAYAFRAKYAESVGSNGSNTLVVLDNGNVGIGTSSPNATLDVNGGVMLRGTLTNTSSRPTVGSGRLPAEIGAYGSGGSFNDDGFLRLSAGGGTNGTAKTFIDLSGFSTVPDMNANLTFGTAGTERMRITAGGLVGIGTTTPNASLDVNGGFMIKGTLTNASGRPAVGSSRLAAEIGGYSSVGAYSDDGFLRLSAGGGTTASAKTFIDLSGFSSVADMNATVTFGTTGAERMRINSSGYVGIANTSPSALLHIGTGANAGPGGLLVNTGWINSSNYGEFRPFEVQIRGTPAMVVNTNGSVGIGTSTPGAPLSVITSAQSYGFTVGDGTREFGTFLSSGSNAVQIGSKSNHPLQLFTNGGAAAMTVTTGNRVGIGTASPTAPLHVAGTGSVTANLSYYIDGFGHGGPWGANPYTRSDISIYASNSMVCPSGFFVISDARTKNVIGVSNGKADLATLSKIQVTDYTFRDVPELGPRVHKKVVAQQVEQIFPQAVSQFKDVVADIYKSATIVDGWIQLATDLRPGERVRLINEAGTKDVHEVLEVSADRFRTACPPAGKKVFVYGREVDDFRIVDYEAIAMLNVSATQELKREKDAEIAGLRAENSELRSLVAELKAENRARDTKLAAIEKLLSSERTVMARPASARAAAGEQE